MRSYEDELKKQGKSVVEASNPAAAFEPKTVENDVQANVARKKPAGGNAQYVNALTGQPSSVQPVNPAGGGGKPAALAQDITAGGSVGQQNGNENADFGVRNYLEQELGIDGKRVGWDGENVTFDGNPLIKAERVSDEGRSFVGDKSAVDAAVGQYAQEHGMVAVRDYANSLGTPMNISWNGDNGTVEINGQVMKPDFISNGKAYVYKNKLDQILEKADNGFRRSTDYLKDAYDKYGGGVDEAYNALMNYGDFSYDQKGDRAYQDFMDVYRRAVEDEYNTNMAQARFRTGGLASPAVMSQAAAVRARALDDAAKYGQQYEDRAYDRWKDTRDFKADDLATAWGMLANEYGLNSGANKEDMDAYYTRVTDDRTGRLFEQQLESGNLDVRKQRDDLITSLLNGELARKYAPGFAENEWKQDVAATNSAERADNIGAMYDEPMAQEDYSQAVNTTKGMELANDTAAKNLNWLDALNGVDLISALSGILGEVYNWQTLKQQTGVTPQGADKLTEMVLSYLGSLPK